MTPNEKHEAKAYDVIFKLTMFGLLGGTLGDRLGSVGVGFVVGLAVGGVYVVWF